MPPNAIVSAPIVSELFVNDELPIFDKVFEAPEIVLFVSVSVDVSVTIEPSVAIVNSVPFSVVVTPEPPNIENPPPSEMLDDDELSSLKEIVEFAKFAFVMPALPDNIEFVIPEIVLLPATIVLFVNASEPAKVAKLPSVNAVLNCAVVPVTVFEPRAILLFESVVVPEAVTTEDVSKLIVKSLPEIAVVTAVPPKILNTSPLADMIASVELSSCSFHVPSTVVPSPIAV